MNIDWSSIQDDRGVGSQSQPIDIDSDDEGNPGLVIDISSDSSDDDDLAVMAHRRILSPVDLTRDNDNSVGPRHPSMPRRRHPSIVDLTSDDEGDIATVRDMVLRARSTPSLIDLVIDENGVIIIPDDPVEEDMGTPDAQSQSDSESVDVVMHMLGSTADKSEDELSYVDTSDEE